MSAMFGKTITDQSYRNAAVGNTLVADQLFARSVNFTETNIMDGIDPEIPIRTLRIAYPLIRRQVQPEEAFPLLVDVFGVINSETPAGKTFHCYEIKCLGEIKEVADQTFNVIQKPDDEHVITGGSVKDLVKNCVIVSVKDYNDQSFGGCGIKIGKLLKLKKDDVLEVTFSESLHVEKFECVLKGVLRDENEEDL